jgi:hypothetical protein
MARTPSPRKATTEQPRKAGTTRKAAAKTTRAPRKATATKPAKPALSLVTNTPDTDDRSTVVDLRPPVPVRRKLFVGPMGPNEQAAIRAALAAAALGLPVPVRAWTGSQAQLADGLLLIHNPGPDRMFTAQIACRHGAIHGWPISTAQQLREARALTHACERRHAAPTTHDDGITCDYEKAIQHGIRPTNRLAEGIKTIRKARTTTQSLHLNQITDGLKTQAADTEPAKEHPKP